MPFHVGGKAPTVSDPSSTNFTPGPGAYNATTGFDHHNKAMQSAKTLQEFGLDQFGIQLVKPHTSFASKVQRFKEGLAPAGTEHVPGPGQYYQEPKWIKTGGTASQWNNKT